MNPQFAGPPQWTPQPPVAPQWPVPVAAPTMPCFGGPDLKTLYLTSLSSGVSDELLERHPMCGTLVQLEVGVAGVPVSRFAD